MKKRLSLEEVCELAKNIPCSPWLLPKLMKLLHSPDQSNADDIQALIQKDPGLVTSVLRLANSAFFSLSTRCDSVAQAVFLIGFKQVYRIAASSIAGRWLANQPQAYGWEPGDLYKHSLCVAVSAAAVAKETGKVSEEVAYTAGLLHDVGKLALAHACSSEFEEIRVHQAEHNVSWRQAENEVLGFDHTEIGGALMVGWDYPPSLVEVARYYPRPQLADPEQQPLVVHVHAAKHLATALGYGVGEDGFHTELDEKLLQENGITEKMLETILPRVVNDTEKLISGGMPTP